MSIISYDAPTFTPFGSIRFGELMLLVQYLYIQSIRTTSHYLYIPSILWLEYSVKKSK
jgi:hypothetical protein